MDYAYDGFNQLVGVNTNKPFEEGESATVFVQDGGQVVLQFDAQFDPSPVDLEATDLSHRYLWGPAVDQLLADEQVTSLESAGEVLWAMTDNLGSVRDVIDSNGDLRIHRQFDGFGNIVDETHLNTSGTEVTTGQTGYVDEAFAFTGRYFDKDTGLQNNLNRWYDPTVGRWMSEDPIGFAAGDANLYRYVGNSPTIYVDPTGQTSIWPPKPRNPYRDRVERIEEEVRREHELDKQRYKQYCEDLWNQYGDDLEKNKKRVEWNKWYEREERRLEEWKKKHPNEPDPPMVLPIEQAERGPRRQRSPCMDVPIQPLTPPCPVPHIFPSPPPFPLPPNQIP